MNVKFVTREFEDLPRSERMKIKHDIAGAALDHLASVGMPVPRTELVDTLAKTQVYGEAAVHYALQSGIARGLFGVDNEDLVVVTPPASPSHK